MLEGVFAPLGRLLFIDKVSANEARIVFAVSSLMSNRLVRLRRRGPSVTTRDAIGVMIVGARGRGTHSF